MTAIDAIRAVEVLTGQGGRQEKKAGVAEEAVMLLRQLEARRRTAG
jgi:hypothetical protein